MRAVDVYGSETRSAAQQMARLSRKISVYADSTTRILRRLAAFLELDGLPRTTEQHSIGVLMTGVAATYKGWMCIFIEDHFMYGELAQLGRTECSEERATFVSSPSLQIYVELSRAFFAMRFTRIMDEKAALVSAPRPSDEVARGTLMLWSLSMYPGKQASFATPGLDAAWSKPLLQFTQREVIDAVYWISGELSVMSNDAHAMAEYKHIVELLHTRIGTFNACYHTADVLNGVSMAVEVPGSGWVCSRDFHVFCSIYMNTLLRRVEYRERYLLGGDNLLGVDMYDVEATTENMRAWMEEGDGLAFLGGEGSDAYRDVFDATLQMSYEWSYDDAWFRHLQPNNKITTRTRGSVVDVVRPCLSKRFHSDGAIGVDVLLPSVHLCTFTGRLARNFVMQTFNFHMRTMCDFDWLRVCCVRNDQIEQQSVKMRKRQWGPLLVQVVGRYWVYNRGRVHMTDDIYETIAVWCEIAYNDYDGHVFDTDLRVMLRPLVRHAQHRQRQQRGAARFLL